MLSLLLRLRSQAACPTALATSSLTGLRRSSDAGNLDLDHVAFLHPQRRRAISADPAGGAGDDDVAGRKLGEGRAIGDQRGHVEHQIGNRRGLHLDAVQTRGDGLLADVRDLVRRHHPGPEAAGRHEILAGGELRGVPLPVANAAVIIAGIAGDVAQRRLARNAAAGLADDHGHLAFIIETLGFQRPDHRLAAADLAVGEASEDHRMRRRGMAALGQMRGVIDADAEDLVRIGNRRQQFDGRQGVVRPLPLQLLQLIQRAMRQHRFQGREILQPSSSIDDAGIGDDAVARDIAGLETRNLHGATLSSMVDT